MREVDQEDQMLQLSHRQKATMFQSIDDVQLQTQDPYYDEVDTLDANTARERHGK